MGIAVLVLIICAFFLMLLFINRRTKLDKWRPVIEQVAQRLGLRIRTGSVLAYVEAIGHLNRFKVRVRACSGADQYSASVDKIRITLENSLLEGGRTSRTVGFINDSTRLVAIVEDYIAQASGHLGEVVATPAQLLECVLTDQNESIRRRSLKRLVKAYGETGEAAQAIKAAFSDPSTQVRFEAVEAVGVEGLRVAIEIAADERCKSALRIRVVRWLGTHGRDSVEASRAIDSILKRSTHKDLLLETLRASFFMAHRPRIDLLESVLTRADSRLRREIARALRCYAVPRSEVTLLKFLGSDDDDLRLEAVKSLGLVGTQHSVEPLVDLTEGFFENADLRAEARQAVGGIQARIGPVEAGALTLATDQDGVGELSLSGEPGALSTTEPDDRLAHVDRTEEEVETA